MASSGYGCLLQGPLALAWSRKCQSCPDISVCWNSFDLSTVLYAWILFRSDPSCFSPLTRCAQSLEKEVQDVKATLQSILAQLKEEEGEEEEEDDEGRVEEELQDDDLMQNGTEEEEEDQYFSDSWDI